MKIYSRKKNDWVWHWIPYCCAEQGNSSMFKGRNYLWLNWMFCFQDTDF